MKEHADFYVYVIFRVDGQPCYVGKGRGDRWTVHARRSHNPHLQAIYHQSGGDLPIVKVGQDLTDYDARQIEISLIAAIGRKAHNGPLVNMTDGGDGVKGHIYTDELREKRRICMTSLAASRSPDYYKALIMSRKGAKASSETIIRLSDSHRGKKHSEETKAKISEKNRDQKRSDEFSLKMRARKGEKRSDQARVNMSIGATGKVFSEAHRANIGKGNIRRYEDQDARDAHSQRMKRWWAERKRMR